MLPSVDFRGFDAVVYNLLKLDREQGYLIQPSLLEWLAEGDLAWFILDAVEQSADWLSNKT